MNRIGVEQLVVPEVIAVASEATPEALCGRGGGRSDYVQGRLGRPVEDWPALVERLIA